ncbi:hypothetical protein NC651_019140 [Populus alba x Populus x berolinensis]|nr:hypothetical protein NC651_019140 [Populus alba x Populus x berolinensis]
MEICKSRPLFIGTTVRWKWQVRKRQLGLLYSLYTERKETPGKGDVIHMRSSSSCSNESDGQHSSRGVKTKSLRRDE